MFPVLIRRIRRHIGLPSPLKRVIEEVEILEDNEGRKIDEGIKPLVIGLRYHGVKTFMSCEGHQTETRRTFPWVNVEKCSNRLLQRLVLQYNNHIIRSADAWAIDEIANLLTWVLEPTPGGGLILIPQHIHRPLCELQESARKFGEFLQALD